MAPRTRLGLLWAGFLACGGLLCESIRGHSADAPPPAPAAADASALESALAPLKRAQEQQEALQQAIDQARREAESAARRNADLLTERLAQIQQSLESQHRRELEAVQASNRTTLLVAGVLAASGFLGMFCLAFFLMRATHRLTEAAMTVPLGHALVSGGDPAGLQAGHPQLTAGNPAEVAGARFLGAIEQLEKRLQELEHGAHPLPPPGPSAEGGAGGPATKTSSLQENSGAVPDAGVMAGAPVPAPGAGGVAPPWPTDKDGSAGPEPAAAAGPGGHLAVLLAKGQTLLSLDKPDEALVCFEEVLVLEPRHAEGLVKKGTALERLGRTDEALECYDRAIAVDGSLTTAYLHKGGVFNRLERYEEALKCYEQALQSEPKE